MYTPDAPCGDSGESHNFVESITESLHAVILFESDQISGFFIQIFGFIHIKIKPALNNCYFFGCVYFVSRLIALIEYFWQYIENSGGQFCFLFFAPLSIGI